MADTTTGLKTLIKPVLNSHDKGEPVYDAVVSARTIHRMFAHGLIQIDDERQRGRNTVSGKQVFSQKKVDRWAEQLLKDEAVFGQLTWNFRPEDTSAYYSDDDEAFVIEDGAATLPDSAHRHRAIAKAVESVSRGSSFDLEMPFSVRIWQVSADVEKEIFYGMNQEGDKADATRSKYLMQRNVGEKIARELVRRAPDLTETNVETVSNTLSTKNPRLAAFNTLAVACERNFDDVSADRVDAVVGWLIGYWTELVRVRPELGILPLKERQRVRKESLVGSALAIHGYIGLARRFYDDKLDLRLVEALRVPDGEDDPLAFTNSEWQDRGIVVPGKSKAGKTTLTVRNALQTRRAMTAALAEMIGLEEPVPETPVAEKERELATA